MTQTLASPWSIALIFSLTLTSWGWALNVLYLAVKYLNVPNKWLAYGNETVMPFYLLHQPVIIVLAFFVVQWASVGLWIKLLVVMLGSLTISLGTIELAKPPHVTIEPHPYEKDKSRFRLRFTDASGLTLTGAPIIDLRLRRMVEERLAQGQARETAAELVNERLENARRVFLRLGLSRRYQKPDAPDLPSNPDGFWLQVTGVYPLPDFAAAGQYDFSRARFSASQHAASG